MSPSSNLPSWSHFSRPQHVGTRSFVLGVLVGILIALLPWEPVFVWLAGRFDLARARHEEQKSLSPQAALAYRLDLTYEQVAAKPQDFVGKPVVWCVDHPDPNVSFLEGRPSQPLVWSNDEAVLRTGPKGHCTRMLAVVEGAGLQGVRLRFIGLP
ncbi:MAG: hypothetical protein NTY77_13310 [Elusimicrobia bacterium]|nr:hypothetical protein [Elusimicrobiota bacterium]